MKIFFLRKRRVVHFFLAFAVVGATISVFNISGMITSNVFSNKREIPIYSVDRTDRIAAVTFDCAWGADDIPNILSTLRETEIKATFFIVGQWAEKYPETVKMIAQDGHDVSNHSYSHLRMGVLDKEKIRSEIKKCNDTLENLSGKKCDLFRAPYGDYGNSLIEEARKQGYYTIQWDVDSLTCL